MTADAPDKPPEPDFAAYRKRGERIVKGFTKAEIVADVRLQLIDDIAEHIRRAVEEAVGQACPAKPSEAGRAAPSQSSEPDCDQWALELDGDYSESMLEDIADKLRAAFAAGQRAAPSPVAVNMPSRERLLEKTQADPDLDIEAGDERELCEHCGCWIIRVAGQRTTPSPSQSSTALADKIAHEFGYGPCDWLREMVAKHDAGRAAPQQGGEDWRHAAIEGLVAAEAMGERIAALEAALRDTILRAAQYVEGIRATRERWQFAGESERATEVRSQGKGG